MNRGLALGLIATLGLAASPLSPQQATLDGIVHTPAPCMSTDEFPLIEVQASIVDEAHRLKGLSLRFRAEDDPGWYEIALQSTAGSGFQAALPKPLPEAVRIRYYLASDDKPERRSPEYVVNVMRGGCPGARAASTELSERIRVRRTSNEQLQFPRGFSAEEIQSGGLSGATLGIVAGAAGGAGIAALAVSGGESAANPPDTGPQAIRACFTPDPIPDIDSGGRILFDASCTTPPTVTAYQWNFGDGTTAQGSSVEHLFRPGGTYTVTLTVRDGARSDSTSRVVHVVATPGACFVTSPDPPRIHVNQSISFNAECSVGDLDGGPIAITSYAWDFGDGDDGGEGRFVSHLYTAADLYGVTLRVTNADGRQDRTTQFVVVERRSVSIPPSGLTFTTELALSPGTNAQVALNDSEAITAVSGSPQQLRARGRSGENVVEGRLLSEASDPGEWRFDFRGAAGFVPGSIRVDSGEVLTLDASSIVFRVTGKPGPPLRFRFRLEE